jgi:DNA-binding transcriptional LysR family regulator
MVNTSEAMKTSIQLGLAPGVISNLAVQRELNDGSIHEVGIEGLSMKRPFYLVVKNIENISLVAKTFLDFF